MVGNTGSPGRRMGQRVDGRVHERAWRPGARPMGGGLRLLPDGLPASKWELAETTTFAHGAVGLHYRRP